MRTYEEAQAAYEEYLRREDERLRCNSLFELGYTDAYRKAGHNNPAKGTKYAKSYDCGYEAVAEALRFGIKHEYTLSSDEETRRCDSFFHLGYSDALNRAGHTNPVKGTKYAKHYESGYELGMKRL